MIILNAKFTILNTCIFSIHPRNEIKKKKTVQSITRIQRKKKNVIWITNCRTKREREKWERINDMKDRNKNKEIVLYKLLHELLYK